MKKFAKLTALLLSLAMLFTLAACGPKDGEGENNPGGSGGDVTVTHTFTGAYISSASDAHFDFKLEMLSDGTLKMEPGVVFLDLDDYQKTATGKWTDDNGTLKFNIDSEDGAFCNEYEVPKDNGGYTFEMKLSLASFVRPITMSDGTAPAPTPTETPADPTDTPDEGGETASYDPNTLVLPFTPDTSEQLATEFYAGSGTWGVAFGGKGDYEATDSADELFSWVSDGSENYHLTFFKNGTYEYEFTTVGAKESGTWTWAGWTLTVTTAGGSTFTGSITK